MRPYDYTPEENAEIAAAHLAKWRADTAAAKIPEPPAGTSQERQEMGFKYSDGTVAKRNGNAA